MVAKIAVTRRGLGFRCEEHNCYLEEEGEVHPLIPARGKADFVFEFCMDRFACPKAGDSKQACMHRWVLQEV